MLYSADIIKAIARMIGELNIPLIVDPVMIAKGGESLLQQEAINALCSTLLPLATVVTPNIPEAETLTGRTIQHFEDIKDVAQSLLQLGVQCVIIKGGHLANPLYAIDYVFIKMDLLFRCSLLESKQKYARYWMYIFGSTYCFSWARICYGRSYY